MKILITRPIDENKELADKLTKLGHETIIFPLAEVIIHKNFEIPKADGYVITSRNAVKAISSHNINKPIFIVGRQTTDFAVSSGFKKAIYAGKNVTELKLKLAEQYHNLNLIYLSGQDITDDLTDLVVSRTIVYNTNTASISIEDFKNAIAKTEIILFFSSNIAKIFIDFVNNNGLQLDCDNIYALSLSKKIANILAELKFKNIYFAEQPTQDSILELIQRLNEKRK